LPSWSVSWLQQILALLQFAMMESAVLLMDAILLLENAPSLQITIDAVITTNALSIDVPQQDVLIPQLFAMMEMLAPLMYVIQDLDYALILLILAKILISAPFKLVMLRKESSTPQRTVTMVLLALLILAIQAVAAITPQTTLFVMTKILALLTLVF
jgi:hypothetical protein